MKGLVIRGLTARYDGPEVLADIDLDVADGALACVVGPSGSGKSTLLRCIAGLHPTEAGEITVGENRLDGLRPEKRRVGLVPQDAGLFTHLDVARNVGYGLFHLPRRTRRERVAELLELTELDVLAARMPAELSGGQQQRVALARALAPRPRVLLLDEPFSGLDPQLRTELREQVVSILVRLQTTALLVSHDRDEALSLAGQVVVMRDGRVRQSGTPRELYERPVDAWTGRFVGDAVLLPGMSDGRRVRCDIGTLPHRPRAAGPVEVLLRPEQLHLSPSASGGVLTVKSTSYRGRDWQVRAVTRGGHHLLAAMSTEPQPGAGLEIEVRGTALVFDPETQNEWGKAPTTAPFPT